MRASRRSVVAIGAVALLSSALVEGSAAQNPNRQVVEGTVRIATPTAPGLAARCFAVVQRNLAMTSGDAGQGYVGYHFDVSKKTWNHHFQLTATSSVTSDLDIAFYKTFGDVGPTSPPGAVVYGEVGDETGVVPSGSTKAIVCMVTGANATFRYVAGPGVKG